jgi:gliding motility-associated-like protein
MAYPGNGYHVTAVRVTAYKCRQKVAEIYRDIPVIIVQCPPTPTIPPLANNPPNVTFKWAPNDPTSIPLPAGDTVWAGDSVVFYVTSTDIEFLPGFIGQTNYLRPSGSQFGFKFSDPGSGCPYLPCATLDTNNAFYRPYYNDWSGQYGIATKFRWTTSCSHLAEVTSCFTRSNTYNFVFKVLDNWCPAPGMNFQTFAVTVLAPPALEPPQMKCAVVSATGGVRIKWTQPVKPVDDTLQSFRKYIIMRSDSGANGPYYALHHVLDMDSLEYYDATASTQLSGKYYFVRGISSCNDQGDSVLGDTISSMRLAAVVYNSGNSVALNWNDFNPGNRWGNKTTGEYYVHQIIGTDTTIIDTVTESWDTLQINLCYPTTVSYYVTVVDTSSPWGCISNSTISGGTVGDNIAPPVMSVDTVSYDQSNNISLGWTPSSPDIGTYYLYKSGTLLATLPGTQTTYQYTRLPTDPWVIPFSIQAQDTCSNMNTVGFDQYSMKTTILDVIRCDTNKKAIISWNNYNPSWAGGAQYTRIYRSDNNGPFVLIDSVNPLVTTYSDVSINQMTFYKYRVRSWENGMQRGVWSAWDSVSVDSFISGFIIPAPALKCVSWDNDTTIRLTWDKPVNPKSNLNRYMIYHSTDGGATYTALDSVNGIKTSDNKAYTVTEYVHTGVIGNTHSYYMVSKSGCDGLQASPSTSAKIKAIDLSVSSTSDSTNALSWNKNSATILTPMYQVYRDGALIASPPYNNENTSDKWVVCNQQVQYRVGYPGGSIMGCTSWSKYVDGSFEDDTPPAKQFVDSVSMRRDTTFTGMVGWSKNTSKDVEKYYVLKCTAGSYKILDTVNSTSALYYEDIFNAPLRDITQYSVMAVDSCGNNTLTQMNFDCHSTMFLSADMDFCDQSIVLNWNPYTDFISGAGVEYRIYVSSNGGPYIEVGKTTNNKFRYKDLVNGNDYCFYVQGWDNAGMGPFSSSTAVACVQALFIDKPDFAYMKYASVEDSVARLCMKIDLESNIGEYWIRRSTSRDNGYKVIATIPVPDPLTPADSNFCYEDQEVKTEKYSYFYKIDVVDPCGTVGITSNLGRTIVLNVSADNEKNLNILKWNQYEEWAGGVNEYEVYRGTGTGSMKLLRSLIVRNFDTDPTVSQKGEEITFTDDVSSQATSGNGQFCYYIAAKEGSSTFPGVNPQVSKSNIVCTIQYPLFYVPTAFTPNGDGLNDRFLPLGAFHDLKSYHLEIFNRWGEMIFVSDKYTGPDAGWDGTYKGGEVPAGAYVYNVRYKAADGKEFEQQGTVTLTR